MAPMAAGCLDLFCVGLCAARKPHHRRGGLCTLDGHGHALDVGPPSGDHLGGGFGFDGGALGLACLGCLHGLDFVRLLLCKLAQFVGLGLGLVQLVLQPRQFLAELVGLAAVLGNLLCGGVEICLDGRSIFSLEADRHNQTDHCAVRVNGSGPERGGSAEHGAGSKCAGKLCR